MKNICKIISFAIVAVMCFSCVAILGGCKKEEEILETKQTTDSLEDYTIVYPSATEHSYASSGAVSLQKQLKSLFGVQLEVITDKEEPSNDEKEILVGCTNREESLSAQERVTRQEFLVTKDGNKIVIIGVMKEKVDEAVRYFLENCVEKSEDGAMLKNIDEYLDAYDYAYEETSVRIMSLNLRYANTQFQNNQKLREPRIKEFVKDMRPTSIGVQECEPFWRQRLVVSLGALGYVPVQEAVMVGSSSAFKNFIWYNPEKTTLIDSGTMWLSETPDKPSTGFGAIHYISAGWAIFEDKETGAQYAHVNTHLTAGFNNLSEEQVREIQKKELGVLLGKVEELENKGYKVFVTGDFNSDMTTDIYKNATAKLLDSRKTAENTTTLFTFNGYSEENVDIPTSTYKCIDYCYYTEDRDIYIEKFNVFDKYDGGYMSDHNALLTDVVLYKR